MKTLLLVIGLGMLFVQSFSQIVLTVDDLPKPGDVQIRARIDSLEELTLDPGSSGANVTWEFGGLNFFGGLFVEASDSVMWVNAQSTAMTDSFPQADIAQKANCYLYHNIITHALSLICYDNYYTVDSSGLHLFGSTYPQNHFIEQPRNIFPLLQYQDTCVNSSKSVIHLSPDSTFISHVMDTTIADGWGLLLTPVEDINALRYYTKEHVIDSLYVNGAGQEIRRMDDNYYYKWYVKDVGFPVFQISKGILENQPDYRVVRFKMYLRRGVGIYESKYDDNETKVFPNPVTSYATIKLNEKYKNSRFSFIVFDNMAKECLRFENLNAGEITFSKDQLKAGMYFYQVIEKGIVAGYGKFVIF